MCKQDNQNQLATVKTLVKDVLICEEVIAFPLEVRMVKDIGVLQKQGFVTKPFYRYQEINERDLAKDYLETYIKEIASRSEFLDLMIGLEDLVVSPEKIALVQDASNL